MEKSRMYVVPRSARDKLRAVAHNLVDLAIKQGRLPKPKYLLCADCDKRGYCYDHRDYRKPLDVEVVCRGCNNRRGPGLPLPTKDDMLEYKTAFRLRTGESNCGLLWSKLAGGEGFSPLEYQCHVDVNDYECWWLYDDKRQIGGDYGPRSRSDFFKQHDPYYEPAFI